MGMECSTLIVAPLVGRTQWMYLPKPKGSQGQAQWVDLPESKVPNTPCSLVSPTPAVPLPCGQATEPNGPCSLASPTPAVPSPRGQANETNGPCSLASPTSTAPLPRGQANETNGPCSLVLPPAAPHGEPYSSLSNAYRAALERVYARPTQHSEVNAEQAKRQPPGFALNRRPCREVLNWSITIDAPDEHDRIATQCPFRNVIIKDYFEKEAALFDAGDCHGLTHISKVWDAIKTPEGHVHSNYGYMVHHLRDLGQEPHLLTPWEWAKQRLILCKDTNQAVLLFLRPRHQYETNLDQPCTTNVQFIIRNDCLHLFAHMRSNDVVYGTPYNWMYFTRMLHRMIRELRVHYPSLRVGKLVHHATSLHMYEHHATLVQSMLGSLDVPADKRGFGISSATL